MKNLVYLFILILGITSCNSDDETGTDNSDLIGKWNWTDTYGGIAFHIHETPETTGKIIHLTLMENYNYLITENGNEVSSGTYEIIMEKSIYSGEFERFIQVPEDEVYYGGGILVIGGIINNRETNEIEISDNRYDGIGSMFTKVE